ncbi:ABC transporter ATP-binding protein [Bradyrhizobium sp. 179]|uniref:ABC transporter ATP-binding protein n=1 Tax=Bradyrhizobium sp. 179 TaxID=2782648 RepID=UPI001FFB1CB9|nr:ABC transporter ATP-binding protein [Bradyrhizobium sp. 179]MCK1540958.1 ABC transporter ATP-binding protein [Bradyrhizobium sp. 179]
MAMTSGLNKQERPHLVPDKPQISLSGVTKRFGSSGFVALDGITIDIPQGQFFVIVGPSGCGKTTLLRILAGLDTHSAGTVAVNRTDEKRPVNSMIFQGDSLFPWMTVFDNAAYGLRMRRVPEKEVSETVASWLERIGLWRFRDRYPGQLSGGMRQRVSIVRAFANDPEILFMDEPFSALDEQNKLLLHEELLRIWEATKKTVVFITHSVDEAVTLGDRIMIMTANPGRAKGIIDVPFPRPRSVLELRQKPAYGDLVFHIWEQLREEVQRARQNAEGEKV